MMSKNSSIGRKSKSNRKLSCKNGHSFPENLRPGRYDCAICHKEKELQRARNKGIPARRFLSNEERLNSRQRWEATRRARKLKTYIEDIDRSIVFVRDEGICGICGSSVGEKYEIDHVIAIANGGRHAYDNVQLAHPICNRKKWKT
jgi:5-methylcytosine-specific restriction endonuclease McrA